MDYAHIGIIGGTGLYDMEGLTDVEERTLQTPFGPPSDAIRVGTLAGMRVAFLARHGHGHRLLPAEVPYRANIWALKSLGVEQIIAISTCGSMKDKYAPGDIIIPDQLFDRTRRRDPSFFGDGLVAHISFAEPFCPNLRATLAEAARKAGGKVHEGGTYVIIEGPRFSSRGESMLFRSWGMDIIGMTTIPEAQLAREAEICYAVMAHVTDYDCWHETEEAVTVELVFQTLQRNAELATRAVRHAVEVLAACSGEEKCMCRTALRDALVTPWELVPEKTKERLRPMLGKYMR